MRSFLRTFADRGGTVFLSSHLLAEVAHSADDAIVIHHGRLVSAGPRRGPLVRPGGRRRHHRRRGPAGGRAGRRGATVARTGPDTLTVTGAGRASWGAPPLDVGAVVTDLHATADDLESVFAEPHPPPGGNLMTSLVRIELLKLRTTPAAYARWLWRSSSPSPRSLTTILLAGQPGTAPLGSVENVSHVLSIGVVTSFSMLILGVMLSAGEDRHRTSLGTYLAEPRGAGCCSPS